MCHTDVPPDQVAPAEEYAERAGKSNPQFDREHDGCRARP